jgi:hypothetical protein
MGWSQIGLQLTQREALSDLLTFGNNLDDADSTHGTRTARRPN